MTVALWGIASRLKKWPLIWVIVFSPLLAFFHQLVHWEFLSIINERTWSWRRDQFKFKSYLFYNYTWSLFYMTWLLGYFAITNYFKFLREAIATAEARTQAHAAQLAMLRYQINPHFLFNTLNSVSSLVLSKENDKAEEMIERLSRFLRFSLDNDPETMISLQEEFEILEEYLAIEKIRFDNKLEYEIQIEGDIQDCVVPSLILQPAIENALKHAIAVMKRSGIISVRARKEDNKLILNVTDNGPGYHPRQVQLGVGMRNIMDRIEGLYGSKGSIDVVRPETGGVEVVVTIPFETSKPSMKVN